MLTICHDGARMSCCKSASNSTLIRLHTSLYLRCISQAAVQKDGPQDHVRMMLGLPHKEGRETIQTFLFIISSCSAIFYGKLTSLSLLVRSLLQESIFKPLQGKGLLDQSSVSLMCHLRLFLFSNHSSSIYLFLCFHLDAFKLCVILGDKTCWEVLKAIYPPEASFSLRGLLSEMYKLGG